MFLSFSITVAPMHATSDVAGGFVLVRVRGTVL